MRKSSGSSLDPLHCRRIHRLPEGPFTYFRGDIVTFRSCALRVGFDERLQTQTAGIGYTLLLTLHSRRLKLIPMLPSNHLG
jgi:hypothetical protein